MSDLARFRVLPPPRCAHLVGALAHETCSRIAVSMTPETTAGVHSFFCVEHRRTGCVPIAGVLQLRRVSLTAEILLAGTASAPTPCKIEALDALERAVGAAGGILGLNELACVLGAYAPPQGVTDDDRATDHTAGHGLRH